MHPHPHYRPYAFTLVELLTVIAIIAILMGLLFPAINSVKDQARKAEAKTACLNIVSALKAYNTEYGKYPYPSSGTPPTTAADVIVGDNTVGGAAAGNENLFNILRSKNAGTNASFVLNPRRIPFFEGKDSASPTNPKGGFSTTGGFFDPWGAQYCVAIDLDYDNQLNTLPYTDFKTTTTYPQTGVGAYSIGKDGKLGVNGKFKDGSTASDDIISWQ